MTDIEERTYYELLGVAPTATTEEIKEAYREIARIFHPDSKFYSDIIADSGPGDGVFKAITNAYQTLINEQRRREYDESLNFDAYSEWDSECTQEGLAELRDSDIPEEWRKEREFFEQHFEEILKPAPKVDLVGTPESDEGIEVDSSEPEGPPEDLVESRIQLARFGRPASENELSFVASSIPVARRPHRVRFDLIDVLLYVGIPVMFLIVLIELYLYL